MVFSSITFLFYFLPAALLLYYIVPGKLKNAVLFFLSLIFYAWGEPVYVVLMIFSTILDYTLGRIAGAFRGKKKAKAALFFSVVINLGLLCTFKYSGFVIRNIGHVLGMSLKVPKLSLPIGISFYAFQTMSYTIDVYRGKVEPQKSIIRFGAYVALFPQLIAGPIVRYETIAEELEKRVHSPLLFAKGAKRFLCGLAKKVLLANNIGLLWESMSAMKEMTIVSAWLAMIAYGFQIYFDFSGYSDMAIGLGSMFGFHFPENFEYPFLSGSLTEFWRRWHISLGSWFRDYVYIPLGGSRKGNLAQYRNILIVWFLTGLWHGASWNFVLWGLYFGIFLILEKLFLLKVLEKIPVIFRHIYGCLFITISWVLFAFEDLSRGREFFGTMFGFGRMHFWNGTVKYELVKNLPLLCFCVLCSLPVAKKGYAWMEKKFGAVCMTVTDGILMAGALVISTAYLIGSSYNPFLYFRF